LTGNTVSTRDRNVYRLIRVGNSWKIDEVSYPDKEESAPPNAPARR